MSLRFIKKRQRKISIWFLGFGVAAFLFLLNLIFDGWGSFWGGEKKLK